MKRILLALTVVLGASTASAQTAPAPTPAPAAAAQGAAGADTATIYDKIWQQFTLYDDKNNHVVQRVQLSGRFQHEFVSVGADQGDLDEWNTRRFRVGPRLQLFRTFTVASEAEFNPQERDPLYMRLTDVFVQWSPNARLAVTVGKQGMPFTMDGMTSSKELLTIDRSNVTNNMWFPQEYLPGVSVSGRTAPWTYRVGMYSSGEMNREFGKFDGSISTLALVGYDFGKRMGVKEALLTGNYVHQSPDTDNTFTRQLEHVASVNLKLEDDKWGLRSDLSTGAGYFTQSDLWGVMVMPYYNITDKLQAITRYTYLSSDGVNGVQLGTYENRVVRGRGDEYNEVYLGANYFIYGQKLKLQTGLQFADMNDRASDGGAYSGTAWTTGLRIGWP
jgi:phosphate-selective porin OprO/OprP